MPDTTHPPTTHTIKQATQHITDIHAQLDAATEIIDLYKALIDSMAITIASLRSTNTLQEEQLHAHFLDDEWGEYEVEELYEMYNECNSTSADDVEQRKQIDQYGTANWGNWVQGRDAYMANNPIIPY